MTNNAKEIRTPRGEKEQPLKDAYLVQVEDDLETVSKLPLGQHVVKIKFRGVGRPPVGKLVEKAKVAEPYTMKIRKFAISETEYTTVGGMTVENPNIPLLITAYRRLKLNPKISLLLTKDGSSGSNIPWRAGRGKLTAIANKTDGHITLLTEKQALKLAKDSGGHVCAAEFRVRTLSANIIRCLKNNA